MTLTAVEYSFFAALILLLVGAVGFFIHREITVRDKLADKLEQHRIEIAKELEQSRKETIMSVKEITASLDKATAGFSQAVNDLTKGAEQLKLWTFQQFATKPEVEKAIQLREDTMEIRLQNIVDRVSTCRDNCPLRSPGDKSDAHR
jgi:hypothetical protein